VVYLSTRSDQRLIDEYLDWAKRYLAWTPATVKLRTHQLKHLGQFLETRNTTIAAASQEDLRAFTDQLRGGADCRANVVSCLHKLYEYVIDERDLRTDDPTRKLRRPRVHKRKPRPMPVEHVQRALTYASADPQMLAVLAVIFCCGLRVGEIARLTTDSLEPTPDGGRLFVIGKGNKDRLVPVPPLVMDLLRPLPRGSGPLFPRPSDGKHHSANGMSSTVNRFLHQECAIPQTAHRGRARFATDFHERERSVLILAEVLGHSDVSTTMLYTEVDADQAVAPMAAIATDRLAGVPTRRRRVS
jgi:site-specific recombinase XerD